MGVRGDLPGFAFNARLVGVSCWVAWITLIYSAETLIPGAARVQEMTSLAFAASTFSLALSLIAASFAPKRAMRIIGNRAVMGILSFAGALATLTVVSAGIIPSGVIVIAAALTGLVTSFIALRAAMLFAEMDAKSMLLSMCCALILGVLIYSFVTMLILYELKPLAVGILLVLLPAAALSFPSLSEETREFGEGDEALSPPHSFWRFFAYVAVLMFMLSMIRGYYPNLVDSAQFAISRGVVAAGLVLGSLIIAFVVAMIPRGASFGLFCYALLSVSGFVTPLLVLLNADVSSIGSLSAVLFGTTLVCIWGLLCRVSFCSGASVIRVFGMGFGSACLGTTMGFAVGGAIYLHQLSPTAIAALCGCLLVVCAAAVLLLLGKGDVAKMMEPPREELDASSSDGDGSFGESASAGDGASFPDRDISALDGYRDLLARTCGYVAIECGLSPRESEVLGLLVAGKNAKGIAAELYVSFNTVRTHIRKIYLKAEVHNRDELMRLVEEKMREGSS